jgi:hypothetical protein
MRRSSFAFCSTVLLSLSVVGLGQQKTETTRIKNDDIIKCSSTTTDTAAQEKANQEAADTLVGKPIMALRINRGVKKYCKKHPGEPYHWTMPDGQVVRRGVCPAK